MALNPVNLGAARGPVGSLARRYPDAVPMRAPVRLSGRDAHGRAFSEYTMIEFGTASEVLFASVLPLELGDVVRLASDCGSLDVTAKVVAAHYQDGKTAAAAQLAEPSALHGVAGWSGSRQLWPVRKSAGGEL